MSDFLSQEWLDRLCASGTDAEPAGDDAASALVQYEVTGGPQGAVQYWTRLVDGRPVEAGLGTVEKPDLAMTVAYDDALRLDQGELEPSVAYMQGRLKPEGDMVKLFALLKASHTLRA